jgi:hypothetical protein
MNPRDRRVLVAGMIGTALLLGGFKLIPAWVLWRERTSMAAIDATQALAFAERQATSLERIVDTLEVRVDRLRVIGDALVVVSEPSEAVAVQVTAIQRAALLAGVRIEKVTARLDSVEGAGVRRVIAHVEARGDVTGLGSMLVELEAGRPLVSVGDISIHPIDIHTSSEAVEELNIRLSLESIALVAGNEPGQ